MKHTFYAFSSLIFASITPIHAQDTGFDPLGENLNLPKMIRVMVEFIEVPLPELSKLLAEPKTSTNDTDLRAATTKLIENKTAKHIETQFVIARSGETATAEGILEYIYPTEYEPAELPSKIVNGPTNKDTIELYKNAVTGPTPTAFETTNLGSSLEIQPTLGVDDEIIDLRFAPQLTKHMGNEIWAEWNGPHGESHIRMPKFFVNRITTGMTLISGQYCLASTSSMEGKDGTPDHQRKLLIFVRADVITVGK